MTQQQPSVSARALGFGFEQLVRRGLRGVWVRGVLPASGCVWAANHQSWWDGFVAAAVLRKWRRSAALMMDGDNLGDYRFLTSIGVISTKRVRQGLQGLRDGRVLVLFPEGELTPAGPLGKLSPGAAWLARQAPAPLVPVAVRVVARGHQYPEALVDIAPPCLPERLSDELGSLVSRLDAELRRGEPREPVPGFERVIAGRPSWDERIDRWSSRVGRR